MKSRITFKHRNKEHNITQTFKSMFDIYTLLAIMLISGSKELIFVFLFQYTLIN